MVTADKILLMQNIRKEFFSVPVLKNVTLELAKGEILGLVGENGAGKSTLMKILSGAYSCDSYHGEIIVDDVPRRFHSTSDSEASGIEMIYQEISLHLDLTVAENIFLGRLPRKRRGWVDRKELHTQAAQALELVRLDLDTHRRVRSLSTSQQQLLSIAKAMVRRPKILVLDEPTSALTESEAETLLSLLRGLRDKGIACIYISHKLDEVFKIVDRITVMRDGTIVANYRHGEIMAEKVVEDMVGRKIENMYPKCQVEKGKEVLRVRNLTVPHPLSAQKNIIEGVSFNLHRGEVLGLAGLVGSGRSELVNAIFGAIPTRGKPEIYIEGQLVRISRALDAIEAGIGLVTEDRRKSGFVGTLRVDKNISLASLKRFSKEGFIKRKQELSEVQGYVEKLRIKVQRVDDSVLTLSGGNQQKVVLAKWLMREVKVLILDEPTRGIDVGAKVEIYNLINELAQKGVGVIMISSELPELISICDRFLVLAKGRIQDEFDQAQASQERIMKAATGLTR
ncbi:Putative ABC transporter [Acididesulfobacillus acetoxydans]|uniref:ABC transporter n=1 Tax=Acididesulfobacillus acetoxydans TaxID=1561005 RepID=A0A8S0X4R3_9FIRM|nr:sugar ABC transporter ATP-binding protein [Acididesulfobacillus acetoxydans]CAA7601020.1 Putative ABC transporter [Acididesulfobacillus acetoxydans]CEJ06894.1 Xylose import ATP-binding protein XylG [Acididesulfobacillus acetoxydans]